MRRHILLFTLALALPFGGAGLAAETWRCEVPGKKATHFLAGPVVFRVNPDGQSVAVYNPMIMGIFKEPLQVKLGKNSDQVMRAWWKVKKIKTSKGTTIPTLRYSATVLKAQGKMHYHVASPQYDDDLGVTGTCKRIE